MSFNTAVFERTPEEQASLDLGRLQNAWHMEIAEKMPPDRCAGCGDRLGNAQTIGLADGTRVHFKPGDYRCLTLYGERWRGDATKALVELGLVSQS